MISITQGAVRLFLVVALLWAGANAVDVLKVREAARWPAVSGTVVTSFVRRDTIGFHSSRSGSAGPIVVAVLHVTYTYRLGGQEYTGSRIGPLAPSRHTANPAWLPNYPVGGLVTVHYDPDDRTMAVIDTSVPWNSVFQIVLAFCFAGGVLVIRWITVRLDKIGPP